MTTSDKAYIEEIIMQLSCYVHDLAVIQNIHAKRQLDAIFDEQKQSLSALFKKWKDTNGLDTIAGALARKDKGVKA